MNCWVPIVRNGAEGWLRRRLQRVVVDDADAGDLVRLARFVLGRSLEIEEEAVELGAGRVVGVGDNLPGELHIVGGERRAVVPGDALAQGEGVDQLVLAQRPGLGEVGDRLAVDPRPGEAAEEGGRGLDHGREGAEGGEDVRPFLADQVDGGPAGLGGALGSEGGGTGLETGGECGGRDGGAAEQATTGEGGRGEPWCSGHRFRLLDSVVIASSLDKFLIKIIKNCGKRNPLLAALATDCERPFGRHRVRLRSSGLYQHDFTLSIDLVDNRLGTPFAACASIETNGASGCSGRVSAILPLLPVEEEGKERPWSVSLHPPLTA